MRRLNKILAIVISIVLLLTSCATSSENNLKEISTYLSNKQYNECYQFVSKLNEKELSAIKTDIENLLLAEFTLITETENFDLNNPYTLTEYTSNYTDSCKKLWSIALLLNITAEHERYTDFAHLRFFAESNDFMRYRELYALMSSVNDNGFVSNLHTQLNEYQTNGDYSNFEKIYSDAKEFDYSQFNPQEYRVDEFRTAYDSLIKALHSLCNGFATNNTSVIATSINSVYDSMSTFLRLSDTLKSVRANQIYIYNTLFIEKDISKNFAIEIENSDAEYSINSNFAFDYLFKDDSKGFIDNSDVPETTDIANPEMPLYDAINIVISALTQTKSYTSDITVTVIQDIDINMTSFESDTKIDSANEITKARVNQILDQANGTRQLIKTFSNGVSEDSTKLSDFIPPSYNAPFLYEEDVESYTVTRGSGGYIIILNLKATETSASNPIASVNTIANGFMFDNRSTVGQYKTYYSPNSVMFVINNSGYLAKLQYNIDGISDCTFYEQDESIVAEFNFIEKYSYTFSYAE